MKAKLSFIILALMLSKSSFGQFCVRVRPIFSPRIVISAGVPPFAGAIWVGPEWRWNPQVRTYVEVPGFWARPRPRYIWRPGHWQNGPYGWQWVPGHWRHF